MTVRCTLLSQVEMPRTLSDEQKQGLRAVFDMA